LHARGLVDASQAVIARRVAFEALVREASTAALRPFERHVVPQLTALSRARFFDIATVPSLPTAGMTWGQFFKLPDACVVYLRGFAY